MSLRINLLFHPVRILSALSDNLQQKWDEFRAIDEKAAQAVLDANVDTDVAQLVDPTGNLKTINRQQALQVSVLFLAEMLGLTYILSMLAKHPKTLVLTAYRSTFDAGTWYAGGDVKERQIILFYLQEAISNCLKLQGFKSLEDDGAAEAYVTGLKNLIGELGLTEEDSDEILAFFLPNAMATEDLGGEAAVFATSAAFPATAETTPPGPDAEDVPGTGDLGDTIHEGAVNAEEGNGNGEGEGEGFLGLREDEETTPPETGNDLETQADTSQDAEAPKSDDEGAGSNDDTDTAPAGQDAADPVEAAEEARDEDDAEQK